MVPAPFHTNDQQDQFPVRWKWVSESSEEFLAAMEPQPLWTAGCVSTQSVCQLATEWPLPRLSVQLRHINVMLRVTLFRRVAELNFRGVELRRLPREVMTSNIHDFNNIAGELARRLASLFHFLKSDPSANKQADILLCQSLRSQN